jgi:apolipoprotein N-acyltransferase
MQAGWRPAAAIASGLLLASAFPPFDNPQAAWIALVPLLIVARLSAPPAAFRWGFWSGLCCWLIAVSWLLRLTKTGGPLPLVVLGWVLLSAYCALYTAGFACVASWALSSVALGRDESGASAGKDTARSLGVLFLLALLWVGFEYLRSTLCTGFSWNTLGVSQYRNLAVIQIAEWGGVYAVSALIMLMNVALAMTGLRMAEIHRRRGRPRRHGELMAALLLTAVCVAWGVHKRLQLARAPLQGSELRVAAIQPNIAQNEKWSEEFVAAIYERTGDLTRRVQGSGPGLIIWPETAVPYCARTDPKTREFAERLADLGAPLLVGSMEAEAGDETERYYNSSMLFMPGQGMVALYRKQHLVPFGEYVPLDRWVPVLQRFAPLGISCTAGTTSTVFRLGAFQPAAGDAGASGGADRRAAKNEASFAVLICFEDTLAGLARAAVRNGARLLINQTNDAWFEGSWCAVQHLSHCVFRCVENRVPAIRCSNLGVTCFIDRTGMIDRMTLDLLQDGSTALTEYRVDAVRVPEAGMPLTFYTRFGDWPFAVPCGLMAAWCTGMVARRWRRGEWRGDLEPRRMT